MKSKVGSKTLIAVLTLSALAIGRCSLRNADNVVTAGGGLGTLAGELADSRDRAQDLIGKVDLVAPCLEASNFGVCYYTRFIESPLSLEFPESISAYPYRDIIAGLKYDRDARKNMFENPAHYVRGMGLSKGASTFVKSDLIAQTASEDPAIAREAYENLKYYKFEYHELKTLYYHWKDGEDAGLNTVPKYTILAVLDKLRGIRKSGLGPWEGRVGPNGSFEILASAYERLGEDAIAAELRAEMQALPEIQIINDEPYVTGEAPIANIPIPKSGISAPYWRRLDSIYKEQIARAHGLFKANEYEAAKTYLSRAIALYKKGSLDPDNRHLYLENVIMYWTAHFPDDFNRFVDTQPFPDLAGARSSEKFDLANRHSSLLTSLRKNDDQTRVDLILGYWDTQFSAMNDIETNRLRKTLMRVKARPLEGAKYEPGPKGAQKVRSRKPALKIEDLDTATASIPDTKALLKYYLRCPYNQVGKACLDRAKKLDLSAKERVKIVSRQIRLANVLYKTSHAEGQNAFKDALIYAKGCDCLRKSTSNTSDWFRFIAVHELRQAASLAANTK